MCKNLTAIAIAIAIYVVSCFKFYPNCQMEQIKALVIMISETAKTVEELDTMLDMNYVFT